MPARKPLMLSFPAALLSLALLAGCEPAQPRAAGGPPPAPKVTVAKPVMRAVADQDEYVGRFVAVDSVEVRARVSGYLDQIHFRDGQTVQQGDLLFTIDKRSFQNTLDQARAYNFDCWVYGSNPEVNADIVTSGLLPQDRADGCQGEWDDLVKGWTALLEPHMR